jgi:3-oxoacyl-(acyl-carrier-protein) synthase
MADSREIANLEAALGRPGRAFPKINATKSLIGHALGAAGSIECVATVVQMTEGFLHPSLNCDDIHPGVQQVENSIVRETVAGRVDIALKNSFGFGDVNACLLFGSYLQ